MQLATVLCKKELMQEKIHQAIALSREAWLVAERGTKTIKEPFWVRNKEVPLSQEQRLKKGLDRLITLKIME